MSATLPTPVAITPTPGAAAGVAGGYTHPTPSTDLVSEVLDGRGGGPVDLTTSYEICRRINAAHGRTYYAATRLLPARKRPHVHALYAFARYADDLVDHMALDWDAARRRAALEGWSEAFMADLDRGRTDDPVAKAVIHTIRTLGVDHDDIRAFLASMAMDLTVTTYATYEDLYDYMYGSAAVIGSMMLPILEPRSPAARGAALDLGVAFQLTNFIRDVAEDHARGRIYFPLEDLRRFGVTDADFQQGRTTPAMRRLLQFEIARTRALYDNARRGWALLPPASARCVRAAHELYEQILDRVEAADYRVFEVRAAVPAWRKAGVVLRQLGTLPPTPQPPRQAASKTTPVPAAPTPASGPSSLDGHDRALSGGLPHDDQRAAAGESSAAKAGAQSR